MADGKDITDRIAREENEADKAAFSRYTTDPIMRGMKAAKDYVMGTEAQNKAASERMQARDAKNPDSPLTKMNKTLGYKKGGQVSSKKSQLAKANGIAQRGKSRGTLV